MLLSNALEMRGTLGKRRSERRREVKSDGFASNRPRLSLGLRGSVALVLQQLELSSDVVQLMRIHGDRRLQIGDTRSFLVQLLFEKRLARRDAGVEEKLAFEFGTFRFQGFDFVVDQIGHAAELTDGVLPRHRGDVDRQRKLRRVTFEMFFILHVCNSEKRRSIAHSSSSNERPVFSFSPRTQRQRQHTEIHVEKRKELVRTRVRSMAAVPRADERKVDIETRFFASRPLDL